MKNQQNHIDKIFNESLQQYERQPRTEAWEKLQARLEKKDSKVLPIWWRYASAASIALLLSVGGYWFNSKKEIPKEIVSISSKPTLKLKVEINKKVEIVKLEETQVKNNVANVHLNAQVSPHVREHTQELLTQRTFTKNKKYSVKEFKDILTNEIVRVQPILIKITPNLKPEIRNSLENNTIVLVLENTKFKKEEETIILNFVDTKVETVAQTIEPEKKQSRVGKIWEQLKRAKNGENVNWDEVGVKPQKILARADAKIENALTRGESNDK